MASYRMAVDVTRSLYQFFRQFIGELRWIITLDKLLVPNNDTAFQFVSAIVVHFRYSYILQLTDPIDNQLKGKNQVRS